MGNQHTHIQIDTILQSAQRNGVLALPHKQLDTIPSSLFVKLAEKKVSIHEINLFRNHLDKIPEELFAFRSMFKNLKVLDLAMNRLFILPDNLSQFEALERLDLTGNKIYSVPSSFSKLTNLQNLSFNGNKLREIPSVFKHLTKLKHLNMRGQLITAIPDGVLDQLSALTVASFSQNKIKKMPSQGYEKLASLKELYLFSTSITELPDGLCMLPKIETLEISDNKLQKLPKMFGNLTTLKTLALGLNQLKELPESFGNLTNLTSLDLYKNHLTSLPDTFSKLSNLSVLVLSSNQLDQLPCLKNMTTLTDLRFAGNHIKAFPSEIFTLTTLSRLDAGFNQIQTLPSDIGKLTILQMLSIAGNKITQLPNEIGNCKLMRILHVGFNMLSSIPDEVAQFDQIQILSACGNRLSSIPDVFQNDQIFNFKYLKSVDISFNKLRCEQLTPNLIAKLHEENIEYYAHQNKNPFFDAWYYQNYFKITKSKRFSAGVGEMIGLRPTMEDAITLKGCLGDVYSHDLYAIFDGHGGWNTARYASSQLHNIISAKLKSPLPKDDPREYLKKLVKDSLKKVNAEVQSHNFDDGSTVVLTLLVDEYIVVANIGDSRAVLCDNNNKVTRLSFDHRPSTPEERKRIEDAGGVVVNDRVLDFGVSRSLGDHMYRPLISAEPYINCFKRDGNEKFIILACDGVWDEISDSKAVSIVNSVLSQHITKSDLVAMEASNKVRDYAFAVGSRDNISVIVILF